MRKAPVHLANLGPVSSGWLASIGVRTAKDLAALGVVNAYALLRERGHDATLNLVWGLEGILRGCSPAALPAAVKARLREEARDALKPRCAWPGRDPLMRRYHDAEWGVPVHDDRTHFEFLILEGAQAGLSWSTILRKRANYRKAFAGFDPARVARFDARRRAALLRDPGIVRNRLKIVAAVANARAFLAVQREFGSFDRYVWRFVGGAPLGNRRVELRDIPARTPESDALSKDLLARGFKFVGSSICYAYMQAVGLANDHVVGCFRCRELSQSARRAARARPSPR